MFFGEERLPVVQEMILAEDEPARRAALDRLLPFQQSDFEGIFEAMAGLPVTIRLLDPPLHEFLPSLEETTDERIRERIKALHEANPMLGTRGCRLGLQWPEIYEMQVRAIVRAAQAVHERTGEAPLVEIMHPLVGFAEELRRLRELTERTCDGGGLRPPVPHRNDDRASSGVHARGRDRLRSRLLLVRHERPHPDRARLSRDDAEGKFLTPLPRGRRPRARSVRDARPGRCRRADANRGRARPVGRTTGSRSGSAASTAATRRRFASATRSASTTSPARRTGCRSPASRQRRRRWPRRAPAATPSPAADPPSAERSSGTRPPGACPRSVSPSRADTQTCAGTGASTRWASSTSRFE